MSLEQTQLKVNKQRCPYCHEDVEGDGLRKTVCTHCLAIHHGACWDEHGQCASCGAHIGPSEPTLTPTTNPQTESLEDIDERYRRLHEHRSTLEAFHLHKTNAFDLLREGQSFKALRDLHAANLADARCLELGLKDSLDMELIQKTHETLKSIKKAEQLDDDDIFEEDDPDTALLANLILLIGLGSYPVVEAIRFLGFGLSPVFSPFFTLVAFLCGLAAFWTLSGQCYRLMRHRYLFYTRDKLKKCRPEIQALFKSQGIKKVYRFGDSPSFKAK